MIYLNKKDFHFGATLAALIGKKYKTLLIDNDSDSRIYSLTSDDDSYIAYIKCCMLRKNNNKSYSWQFVFSDKELEYLLNKICDDKIKLILLCGNKDYKYCEIVIIEQQEIEDSLFDNSKDKKSLTVTRGKGCESYLINRSGGKKNALKIPTNRMQAEN